MDISQAAPRTVFQLEQGGRSVYCSSATCVSGLLKLGWKLSDPQQLSVLVRALAAGPQLATHEPSDHFK